MRRMHCLILLFIMAVFQFSYSQQATNTNPDTNLTAVEYFKVLRTITLDNLPGTFTADLWGKSMANKLESIPKESYLDKNKKLRVEMNYSKSNGIFIEVKNADELYKDLYKDLPRQFFALDMILSSEKNDSFVSKYDISYISSEQGLVLLKLRIKSAENSIVLYADRAKNLIMRVDYMIGKDLISSTIISYKVMAGKNRNYNLPEKFISKSFRDTKDTRPDLFEINNIKITEK
jgi:hypothetical protein